MKPRSPSEGRGSAPVILVRLMVGSVFFFEGVQKFLHPEALGVGRFAAIGIPSPEQTAPFVGGVEVVCGALVLVGLLTRLAALPLLIDISVAILSTKIPVLLGRGFWTFTLPKSSRYGFLAMMHEARTDFSMWLGLLFLILVGPGRWSLDAWFGRDGADD
jgi:putative oxidoreductase